jgi:glutaredoxin-like protein NrdH
MTLVDQSPALATPIQVFTKPGCQPCAATKRKFKELGIDIVEIDISEDPSGPDKVRELGYSGVPVVFDGFEHWQGYIPEKIANAAAKRMYVDMEPLF